MHIHNICTEKLQYLLFETNSDPHPVVEYQTVRQKVISFCNIKPTIFIPKRPELPSRSSGKKQVLKSSYLFSLVIYVPQDIYQRMISKSWQVEIFSQPARINSSFSTVFFILERQRSVEWLLSD